MIGSLLYALRGNFAVPLLLFIIGLLYSKGFKIKDRKIRLKAGYGMKNAVVGFAWGLSVACSLDKFDVQVFVFFFSKLFINSAFFDLKDVKRDKLATLPKIFGRKFRFVIGITNIALHLTAFTYYRNLILILSLTISQIAVVVKESIGRKLIDSESALSVSLYLSCQNFPSQS